MTFTYKNKVIIICCREFAAHPEIFSKLKATLATVKLDMFKQNFNYKQIY